MVSKQDVSQLLDRSYEIELDFVAGLSAEQRSAIGAQDHWSAKDVLAHSAFWKERLSQNLLAISNGQSPLRTEDFDHANAEIFEQYRHKSWDDILALMERAYRSLVKILDLDVVADLESLDVLPWQEDRPIWRNIVGNGYTHPVYHLASLCTEWGDIQRASELNEEMVASLSELADDPTWRGTIRYNLACFYSLAGDKGRAIGLLREALELVPSLTDWSKEDPDFEPIQDEAEYQALFAD